MINLEKILKYQEVDIKLRKTLDEIDRSDLSKKMEQAKANFNSAKNAVSDSEKNAEEIMDGYKISMKAYEDILKNLADCEEKLSGDLNADERRIAVSSLESLKSELIELEKKINDKKSRGDKVLDDYRESQKRGKKMREIFAENKEGLESLKKEKEPLILSLKSELDSLRPEITAELITQYDELSAERKIPAFVESYGDEKTSFSCRGCGLQLSQSSKGKLLDKGMCRCDTCRRVIYLVEKKKK